MRRDGEYMKILKTVTLLVALMFIFTSCTFLPRGSEGGNKNYGNSFEMPSLDKISDTIFEEILLAIENKDQKAIKELFSKEALAEADDIDASIEYLFNLFDGEVISWERDTLSSSESIRNGKESLLIQSWYTVTTENGKYLFLLLNYDVNTIEPKLKGLYTLHAIDDADENAVWTTWQDMKVPGVYRPKEKKEVQVN